MKYSFDRSSLRVALGMGEAPQTRSTSRFFHRVTLCTCASAANLRSIEEEYTADGTSRGHMGREEVRRIESLIEEMRGGVEGSILTEAKPEFSPG